VLNTPTTGARYRTEIGLDRDKAGFEEGRDFLRSRPNLRKKSRVIKWNIKAVDQDEIIRSFPMLQERIETVHTSGEEHGPSCGSLFRACGCSVDRHLFRGGQPGAVNVLNALKITF